MREVKSGDKVFRIRASSYSIFLFKNEFKSDIFKTISKIYESANKDSDENTSTFSTMFGAMPSGYELLQLFWTLHKTQNVAEQIPTANFEKWIEENSDIIIMDIYKDVMEEAMKGFFRITGEKPKRKFFKRK